MKKNNQDLKRRIIASMLAVMMMGSVTIASTSHAYAATTATSTEDDGVKAAATNKKNQEFVAKVIDNAADEIEIPFVKFIVKSALSAFEVYYGEGDDLTEEQQVDIEKIINDKSDEIQKSISSLADQSSAQYKDIISRLDKIADNQALDDFRTCNKKLVDANVIFKEEVNAETQSNGYSRLGSDNEDKVYAAYTNMFGNDINGYLKTLISDFVSYRSAVNGSGKQNIFPLEYLSDSNANSITASEKKFDFTTAKDANDIYQSNKDILDTLSLRADNYADLCKTIAMVKRDMNIYDINKGKITGKDIDDVYADYKSDITLIDNVFDKGADQSSGNVKGFFNDAYSHIDDYLAKSDKLTVGDTSRLFYEPTETWKIINNTVRNNKDVKLTLDLNKDWTSDCGYGFAGENYGTDDVFMNNGFTTGGGFYLADGGYLTINGNNHTIDFTENPGVKDFMTSKDSSLYFKNLTLKGGAYGVYCDIGDDRAVVDIRTTDILNCGTAVRFSTGSSGNLQIINKKNEISNCTNGAVSISGKGDYDIRTNFNNNYTPGDGAAINVEGTHNTANWAYSYARDCTFTANRADGTGGAVNGVDQIYVCDFKNNSAGKNGGAAANSYMGESSKYTINNCVKTCTFEGNTAGGKGGALYNAVNIDNVKFINNTAKSDGGAYYDDFGYAISVKDTTLENNHSGGIGGAMFINGNYFVDHTYTAKGCNNYYGIRTKAEFDNVTAVNNKADSKADNIFLNISGTVDVSKYDNMGNIECKYRVYSADSHFKNNCNVDYMTQGKISLKGRGYSVQVTKDN